MDKQPISRVQAIKQFFGLSGTEMITEFKKLTENDKQTLAELAAKELGVELEPTVTA